MLRICIEGEEMHFARGIVVCCAVLVSTPATSAPSQLFGKSVVVTWSENRIQRFAGETEFRPVNARHEYSMYVSSAGRIFSRLRNATSAGTAAIDQVAGSAGATRVPKFSGQSATVFMPSRGGGSSSIRRMTVDFDSSFASCSAKVVRARQEGASLMVGISMTTGRRVEVQSVTVSGATCSIRAGNVFGN